MTHNAELNALIARLEGGEALSAEISNAIADVVDPPVKAGTILERGIDSDGLPVWRARIEGAGWGSWWHGEDYARSFDAALSLAQSEWMGFMLFKAAYCEMGKNPSSVLETKSFNPEPVLRAMLIEALQGRRE